MSLGVKLDKLKGAGSTPLRRKFWNQAISAVESSRKLAGHNVTVKEQEGKGTLINVQRKEEPVPPGTCNFPVLLICQTSSITLSKYGWTNIHGDCAGSFGTGLRYIDVSYSCDTCGRTLGTGVSDLRYYLAVSGVLSECVAAHLVLGGGCFGHHTGGGDCGCGGSGTISYSMSADRVTGDMIDPSIGNGFATVDSCSGSITHGATTYACSDFDVNALFDNSLSDCGDSITLSSEYTTAQLIEDAYPLLATEPDPDIWPNPPIGCVTTSLRNLLSDEHQVQLRRVFYKFVWVDPAPVDCILRWRVRTFDADDVCVGDEFLETTIHAGDTESEVFIMDPPDGFNGQKDIYGDCCHDGGTICTVTRQLDCAADYEDGDWLFDCGSPCDTSECADA